MRPRKSSYTFVTIPSPVVLPEAASAARSAATTPAATAAAPCQDVVLAVDSLITGAHTTPAAFAPLTAAAAGPAGPSLSADAAAGRAAPSATAPVAPAPDAAAFTPSAGAAAAGHGPASAATGRAVRRGRSRSTMSTVRHKTTLLQEAVKSRREARAASLQTQQRSSSDTAAASEKQEDGDTGTAPAASPSDVSAASAVSCSSNGNILGVVPASYLCSVINAVGSEGSSTASSVSTDQHGTTFRRTQPSLFSPESHPLCGFAESPAIRAGDTAAEPPEQAATAAAEEHSAPRRSQQRGDRDGQKDSSSSSSSPGVTVPSFADVALPPLAVEDAAVMLREFATLLQRLEYSGQQVLQQQKQPQSVRARDRARRRLSPQEHLQQQAVVCSSLSARLQRLFEASAAYTAQPTSPETPGTITGSPGDCSPQKKPRHQLLLPGVRSRAGIQETGSGEEGWPDGGLSSRIALRTLGTFSTIGSNGSISFELAQAYSPPRGSLEQHRGRLRLAKLKEDFERLKQKHERLVTLFNIRMLLPLSRRNSNGNGQSVENSSAAPSPEREAAGSSTKSRGPAAAVVTAGDALPMRLSSSGNENGEGAATGGATALRRESAATAAAEDAGILDSLDFSHFADYCGRGGGSAAVTQTPVRTRRRHSSSMIVYPGGGCSRPHRLASGGVGGACTPLHSLIRYSSSGSSSSSSGGGGFVGHQHGLHSRAESGVSRFYSFNDPNSFSFGDFLLPPIYLGPTPDWDTGKSGVTGADDSASPRQSLAEGTPQREEQQQRQWSVEGSRKAPTDLGARWRRGESSLLFPGEASLENVWRPTRLQEVDEGFEEQQRREQLQQLQHIEECVHVLHELHVQIADEVETAEEPLAAVAAETDAAAVQTAQANRELVTASLRRSRWWGVQGGGVAAAAGVVVGGLAGGPIGAAVGLIFGAFVGATSGSALEREHRHKLSRLIRDRTRRKRKEIRAGEQHMQTSSTGLPALGSEQQQQQVYRGEQELVSRTKDCETAERGSEVDEGGDRRIRERAPAETRRAQPKAVQLCAKQQHRMRSDRVPGSRTTVPQKVESAAHREHAEHQQQQRGDDHFRPHLQGRFAQRDTAFQDSKEPSRSSITATHSRSTASNGSAGAVDSGRGTGYGAVSCSSHTTTAASSSRAGLLPNSSSCKDGWAVGASSRQGGDQRVKHAAARRRRDGPRSPNVPLPALLGLGWGASSVWYPDRKIREGSGPHPTARGSSTLRRPQGSFP